MGTIARSTKAGGGTDYNSGETIDPAEVNDDFNTAYTEINGALDDANIETATIPGAKSLRFTEISDPSSPASNDLLLYAKDLGSTTTLFTKDSGGTVLTVGRGRGEVENLVVKHTTASEASSLTITADAIDIEGYRATSVNVTAAITGSGAGGLDTGAEAGNTHYYVYLILKSTDGTVNGLLSASASSPTMPSGYDKKRLISHRRNDGSSNFIRAFQCNDLVLGDTPAMSLASGITASADLDTSSFVPAAIADFVLLEISQTGASWALDDKDDSTIRYFDLGTTVPATSAWVRKNASNLVTATEVSGTAAFSALIIGWKVKGL